MTGSRPALPSDAVGRALIPWALLNFDGRDLTISFCDMAHLSCLRNVFSLFER